MSVIDNTVLEKGLEFFKSAFANLYQPGDDIKEVKEAVKKEMYIQFPLVRKWSGDSSPLTPNHLGKDDLSKIRAFWGEITSFVNSFANDKNRASDEPEGENKSAWPLDKWSNGNINVRQSMTNIWLAHFEHRGVGYTWKNVPCDVIAAFGEVTDPRSVTKAFRDETAPLVRTGYKFKVDHKTNGILWADITCIEMPPPPEPEPDPKQQRMEAIFAELDRLRQELVDLSK